MFLLKNVLQTTSIQETIVIDFKLTLQLQLYKLNR